MEPMTIERAKQILFCTIQMLRREETELMLRKSSDGATPDWKDVDDYIFSELDIEVQELEEIFNPYNEMVYGGSCYETGQSPRDFDVSYFKTRK